MNYNLINEQERDLLRNGRLIEAIKLLRARTNCGLKEAKDACDDYRRRIGVLSNTCYNQHDFIKVNSVEMDAVCCRQCGAIYRRA